MPLWERYQQCLVTTDPTELVLIIDQFERVMLARVEPPSWMKALGDHVTNQPLRTAVDPQALEAACTLRSAAVMAEAKDLTEARALYQRVLAQFVGGLIGLRVAAIAIGMAIEHPTVNYVVTVPGLDGAGVAFAAEACISFGLMLVVLIVSNHTKLNVWTGVFAGVLVAIYIALEAPLSGMSMNPARKIASTTQ